MAEAPARLSILVVSNDAAVRDMLRTTLANAGYHVTLAGSGAEAMKIVANSSPDYALIDLFLPDYSGVELKRRIVRLSPKTHAVVASSFTTIRSSEDVLRFGASDFILDQREILDLIAAAGERPPAAAPTVTDERLRRCLVETIDVLVGLLEVNDPFFGGNSHITMEYARSVAETMKLGPETVDEIVVAALLHDIGRIGIKSEILTEKKKITEAEYKTIQSHCENGAKILESIPFPWKIKPIITHHHERYDGKGYPSGLKGREIPIGARILAVVDAFAAMTANRPYRRSLTREEAIRELHNNVGTQFDPEVVEIFTGIVEEKYYFRGLGAKPKVLLVDDEVDYLTLVKLRLVNEGFDVFGTDNAEDALKIAEKEHPDIVLSDVVMPGVDGITMFRRLRAKPEFSDTPLIFLSAKDEIHFKVEALHQGAEDYLIKPVDLRELAARIRNVIKREARRRGAPAAGVNPGVIGDLRNLSIPDIVQTLHLGLKTACVTVRKADVKEAGRIFFENGRIRHCELGKLSGEEAFYRLIRWQEGPFVIAHGQTTSLRTIQMDEMQLVMEGLRRMDEEKKDSRA
ncbi:MAG: response regulator [Deltaproteobacteria bacterium]|nr:response regulator [Deltaproteobacteria bacterium]